MNTRRTNKSRAESLVSTGARTPSPSGQEGASAAHPIIDCLCYTLPSQDTEALLCHFLTTHGSGWGKQPGRYGYRYAHVCGGITVLHGGESRQGIHIDISGSGCRFLESTSAFDWIVYLRQILSWQANLTRIDVAIDDRVGLLDLGKISDSYRNGLIVSRFKEGEPVERRELATCRLTANGLYVGSPKSDTQVKFYDKALEQGVSGHWVRVEIRLRSSRAHSLGKAIADNKLLVAAGVFRKCLDFKIRGTGTRRERWKSEKWWLTFLDHAAKFQLSTPARDASKDTLKEWLFHQVAAPLARYYDRPGHGPAAMEALVEHGREKLAKRQERAIQLARKSV